jgi:hypothetical protein
MTRRTLLASASFAPALLAADDDAKSIFDGKTLHGWSIKEGPESAFYIDNGEIVIHPGANFPTWLRYNKRVENFDFRCDFFIKGWANSGIYIHSPEHGRNTECGMKINIFQKQDHKMLPESVGSIFPVVPPLKTNVKNQGEWNTMRIRMDWPQLEVWINNEQVQNLNVESVPELRHRLRSGYIGIESLSYPLRFRNLALRELPPKEKWDVLYESPADMDKWEITDGKPKYEALGAVLRGDGLGYIGTKEKYRDFVFQSYIRASQWHNGGIIFRAESAKPEDHYEIQLHDVEGAVYPTGSLYGFKRAAYPKIEPEKWYLFQLYVNGKDCVVRINGENVVDYHEMDRTTPGPIMLQAHQLGRWIEYKEIKIRRLG